ncbi:hypothetical protein B0O80DRAFT_164557 [Mortierella sp. GBAus27b]|nr:hypothetical protein B0O80DRAFT_164557 [Mortierella sp. GBAus27b]
MPAPTLIPSVLSQASKQALPLLSHTIRAAAWSTRHSLLRTPTASSKPLLYSTKTLSSLPVNPLRQYTKSSLTVFNEKSSVNLAPVMVAAATQEDTLNDTAQKESR